MAICVKRSLLSVANNLCRLPSTYISPPLVGERSAYWVNGIPAEAALHARLAGLGGLNIIDAKIVAVIDGGPALVTVNNRMDNTYLDDPFAEMILNAIQDHLCTQRLRAALWLPYTAILEQAKNVGLTVYDTSHKEHPYRECL